MEVEKNGLKIEGEDEVGAYYRNSLLLATAKKEWRDCVFASKNCLPFLQPGTVSIRYILCEPCSKGKEQEGRE